MNAANQQALLARRRLLNYLAGSPLLARSASLASIGSLLASLPELAGAQSYDVLGRLVRST